jgi:aarF domain-containing kinase
MLKLVGWTGALPKGLFLEKTLEVMKEELKDECDYRREGRAMSRVREMMRMDKERSVGTRQGRVNVEVPKVLEGLTREKVLTMEKVGGRPLGREGGVWRDQEERNEVSEIWYDGLMS